eukprot:3754330-Pyramimonas_sp.AAC.1
MVMFCRPYAYQMLRIVFPLSDPRGGKTLSPRVAQCNKTMHQRGVTVEVLSRGAAGWGMSSSTPHL